MWPLVGRTIVVVGGVRVETAAAESLRRTLFIRDPFAEMSREDAGPPIPSPGGPDGFADSSAFGRFACFVGFECRVTCFTVCRGNDAAHLFRTCTASGVFSKRISSAETGRA